MKTLIAVLFATISSVSFASDLSKDLKTPFEPLTNPFTQFKKDQPLQKWTETQVKLLLESCAFTPVKFDRMKVIDMAHLRPSCHMSTIFLNKNQNEMQIVTPGLKLFVVSWDGSDSDGGDQQAVGIYDQTGKRIAVYPGLYVDGNVIDGLAHAVGANIPEVRN